MASSVSLLQEALLITDRGETMRGLRGEEAAHKDRWHG